MNYDACLIWASCFSYRQVKYQFTDPEGQVEVNSQVLHCCNCLNCNYGSNEVIIGSSCDFSQFCVDRLFISEWHMTHSSVDCWIIPSHDRVISLRTGCMRRKSWTFQLYHDGIFTHCLFYRRNKYPEVYHWFFVIKRTNNLSVVDGVLIIIDKTVMFVFGWLLQSTCYLRFVHKINRNVLGALIVRKEHALVSIVIPAR